jgi:hypothetical protein
VGDGADVLGHGEDGEEDRDKEGYAGHGFSEKYGRQNVQHSTSNFQLPK